MAVLGEQGGDPILSSLYQDRLAVSARPCDPHQLDWPAWLMTSSTRQDWHCRAPRWSTHQS